MSGVSELGLIEGEAPTVSPLAPVAAPDVAREPAESTDSYIGAFRDALSAVDSSMMSADRAESAVVAGTGDLQAMIFERARADALLQVAVTAASRTSQALNSLTNLQV